MEIDFIYCCIYIFIAIYQYNAGKRLNSSLKILYWETFLNHIKVAKVESTRGHTRFRAIKPISNLKGFLLVQYFSIERKCIGHVHVPIIVSEKYKANNLDRPYELHITPKTNRIKKVIVRPTMKIEDIKQEILQFYKPLIGIQLQMPDSFESWVNERLLGEVPTDYVEVVRDAIQDFPMESRIQVWA